MAQIEVILCPTTVASYAQAMAAGRDVTLRALVCTDPIPFDDASAQVERARSLAERVPVLMRSRLCNPRVAGRLDGRPIRLRRSDPHGGRGDFRVWETSSRL